MTNAVQPAAGCPEVQLLESAVGTPTEIHIFVEVSKNDHRELSFDHDQVTGIEIKDAAKVPVDMDLAIRKPGGLDELVRNDELITIKEGEHFVVLPAGTIS